MTEVATVTAKHLIEQSGQNEVDLIDVRTPAEFREVHASLARNVPLDTLDPGTVMAARNGATDKPLYVICQSGGRAAKACQKFIDAGYANVVNVEGGTRAWDAAGLPVVRGEKAMSLERQVRIAAGFIVLVGSVLGFFYPPCIGIAAFVGAGLIFAGITDTCGMAMLLAKMPWNRVAAEGAACSTR
jgi:rhodanese-related sulfurtransferase